jgi:hypothetical protein
MNKSGLAICGKHSSCLHSVRKIGWNKRDRLTAFVRQVPRIEENETILIEDNVIDSFAWKLLSSIYRRQQG